MWIILNSMSMLSLFMQSACIKKAKKTTDYFRFSISLSLTVSFSHFPTSSQIRNMCRFYIFLLDVSQFIPSQWKYESACVQVNWQFTSLNARSLFDFESDLGTNVYANDWGQKKSTEKKKRSNLTVENETDTKKERRCETEYVTTSGVFHPEAIECWDMQTGCVLAEKGREEERESGRKREGEWKQSWMT